MLSCGEYGSVWSRTGGSSINAFTFTNDSPAIIKVWYLAPSGRAVLEATLHMSEGVAPIVYAKQDWMLTNANGGCLAIFQLNGYGWVDIM